MYILLIESILIKTQIIISTSFTLWFFATLNVKSIFVFRLRPNELISKQKLEVCIINGLQQYDLSFMF